MRECSPPLTCHVSHVLCHVSRVTCHVSHVTCNMSHVTCHMSNFFYFFFLTKWLRVSVEGLLSTGHTRLVFKEMAPLALLAFYNTTKLKGKYLLPPRHAKMQLIYLTKCHTSSFPCTCHLSTDLLNVANITNSVSVKFSGLA